MNLRPRLFVCSQAPSATIEHDRKLADSVAFLSDYGIKQKTCFRLPRMHEMQTIVTDVSQSVHLSVTRLNSSSLCRCHSVQPLSNYFGLLLYLLLRLIEFVC